MTALSTDPLREPRVSPGLALRDRCAGLGPLSPEAWLSLGDWCLVGPQHSHGLNAFLSLFPDLPPRGPLNWYRNIDRNWKWGCKGTGRKVSAGLVLLPPPPRLPVALGQSWGWTDRPAGVLLSVLFLWASEVPPQGFPLGPLLLTLLLEWLALGTEQGSDWVTTASV